MSCKDKACTEVHDEQHDKPIEEQIDDAIKKLPLGEKLRAAAMNFHLLKKKALDDELSQKIQQLSFEYEQKSKPIYDKTQEVVQGKYPQEEELKDLEKYLKEGEKEQLEQLPKDQQISEYWLKAMWSNDILAQEIKEQDAAVLKSLHRIEYVPLDVYKYELIFHFNENEYFTNSQLKKTVELDKDDEPIKTTGSKIEWKEGKNTTVKITKKTQKNKKTGAKRTVEKETKQESFFNFFNDSEPLKDGEDKDSQDDEENNNDIDRLNIDFDIFKSFVDEVIPYSLEYFLGIKTGAEDLDYDDQDEEDEEEPEPETKNKKQKGNAKGGAAEKQDCKQQ